VAAHQPGHLGDQKANQNRMDNKFKNITERVRAFIGGEGCDFDELARDLFALQYEHVEPYRHLCESRGVTPQNTDTIPAIPTAAFKEFEITSLLPNQRTTVFHSSGTTGQTPSRHFHNAESLALYEASARAWFDPHLRPNEAEHVVTLTPTPENVPNSSLVYMFEMVFPETVPLGRLGKGGSWELDLDKLNELFHNAFAPILMMGTALSFLQLANGLRQQKNIILPHGSRVLETGGYKGQKNEWSEAELHKYIGYKFGLKPEQIVSEYGMCELSSQAYDIVTGERGRRLFRFPPWARTRIVSPENGREVALGETGLLEVIDLANVRSVLAIRTADLAVRHEDGFELLGRAEQAEPRGCSLNASILDNRRADKAGSRPHA
jgi:phenylacetate-coenzyme A ligase PaaK-like adenylate-forming protein